MPERRPNILILQTDEHNARIMGCAGDPIVRTPNLDRLAAEGVRFTNAYCQGPLCVPSRMSMVTGKQVHKIRVWSNETALDSSLPTLPGWFTAQGYLTVNAGKMHFQGPDQYHGFELRPFGDGVGDTGRGGRPRPPDESTQPNESRGRQRVRAARPQEGGRQNAFDRRVTEESLRFLREWKAGEHGERPFLLWSSWLRPHFPFSPPQRYWDLYDPQAIPLPPAPPDVLDNCPPRLRNWRRHWGLEDLTEEEIRRARAAYYGMVTFADDQIGAVLGELRALGLEDDTIIVYTADHGEMAGEHGLWYKSCFFDGAAEVPMIWRYPRLVPPGRVEEAPVELVDVFPTLAAMAGVDAPLPPGLDGGNLLPVAAGSGPAPKPAAFCEHYTQGVPTAQRMIRAGRWKYNYYQGEAGELYDMEADPEELRNLAAEPAHAGVVRELEAQVMATWDLDGVRDSLAPWLERQRSSGSGYSYAGPNRRD